MAEITYTELDDIAETWEKTMNLRIVKRWDFDGERPLPKTFIQQMHKNNKGDSKWVDIEYINEM